MPKQVNEIPNLRVDVPDFKAQGQEFSTALSKLNLERWVQKNRSVITEGFRVEIADQSSNPGLFTVVNGVAFDRDGQITNNEEDINAKRSYVLTANTTFYVEVEFITDFTDIDARAFWDPSFDNGTDPSGDERPDGREFTQNIATRIASDWTIVQPISTTGFAITTNPDSTRIPVAILTVAAGEISGGSTTPARTNLAESVAGAGSSLSGLDTRHFPDAFTLRIDPGGALTEIATVTANDRENGIFTLSGPTANAHVAGIRLADEDATPVQLLDERTLPPLPTSGTEDARPRFFQADEERGYALTQDPYNDPGKADLEIKSLKDMIDALAAEVREMKFGSGRAADVGDVAPPGAFSAVPRWFETAGGVQGARNFMVSVGDGVNSWGDFNTTQSGSAQLAIQGAIDSLPSAGGTVYIKAGDYNVTGFTIIAKDIRFVGDGSALDPITSGITRITCTGASQAFNVSIGQYVFEHMTITTDSAATVSEAVLGSKARVSFSHCNVEGFFSDGSGGADFQVGGLWERSIFIAADSASTNGVAVRGDFADLSVTECQLVSNIAIAGSRALKILNDSSNVDQVVFERCTFTSSSSGTAVIQASAGGDGVTFTSCEITGGSTACVGITLNGCDNWKLDKVECFTDAGLLSGANLDKCWITDCDAEATTAQAAISLTLCTRVWITSCTFIQTATAAGIAGRAVNLGTSTTDVFIKDCFLQDFDIALGGAATGRIEISGCRILSLTADRGRYGIQFTSVPQILLIENCIIDGLDDVNVTTVAGISISGSLGSSRVTITGNTIQSIGVYATHTIAYGIEHQTTTFEPVDLSITDNTIITVEGFSDAFGIIVSDVRRAVISRNKITDIGDGTSVITGSYAFIWVKQPIEIVISDNVCETAGDVTNTTARLGGIKVGDFAALSTQTGMVSITGNIIRDIQHANQISTIRVESMVWNVTITGNVIEGPTVPNDTFGISVSSGIGSAAVRAITVTGNTIKDVDTGIALDISQTTSAFQDGVISVTGNAIFRFTNVGIDLAGATTDLLSNIFSVIGNTLYTGEGGRGISLVDVSRFTVAGNVVVLDGDGTCIYVFDCLQGAITGNTCDIISDDSASVGIDIDLPDTIRVMVSGNLVMVGENAGNVDSDGILLGQDQFAAANFAMLLNAGGTGVAMATSGADTFTRTMINVDSTGGPPNIGDPTGHDEHGLNFRVTAP